MTTFVATSRLRTPLHRFVRRGSVYIAVLGVATLITVMGVSAVLAVRMDHHATMLTQDAVAADLAAQSTAELALLKLNQTSTWRQTYQASTWVNITGASDATMSFRIVDEADGDLVDTSVESVRIYAQASVGQTLRMYSVRVEEPGERYDNLLGNPGFESGTTDWSATSCSIAVTKKDVHSGRRSAGGHQPVVEQRRPDRRHSLPSSTRTIRTAPASG